MLLEEFDAEKYERTIRSEGREEGRNEREVKVNRFGLLLTEAGRSLFPVSLSIRIEIINEQIRNFPKL